MDDDIHIISKKQMAIELTLNTGEVLKGFVFIKPGERLLDLLNDDRSFIPIELSPEDVRLVQKTHIGSCVSKSAAMTRPHDLPNYGFGSEPMSPKEALKILGLEQGCSKDVINDAFHRIMVSVHPDQGGSTYLAAKVNAARDTLIRMIIAADGDEQPDISSTTDDQSETVPWAEVRKRAKEARQG